MPRDNRAVLAVGVAAAFGLFALTFRGQRAKFWERMTLTGFVLGTMALAIPLIVVAAVFTGLAGVIAVCVTVALVAIVTAR